MRARHFTSTASIHPGRLHGLPAAAGFAWLGGACAALWSTLQPGWGLLAAGAVLALAAMAVRRVGLACLLAGFVVTAAVAQLRLEARWPTAQAGERRLVSGLVASLPVQRGDTQEFDLVGTVLAPAGAARELRVRVRWRAPAVAPRAGERWRLVLRLSPPRASLNPGGPDQERMLFRDGVDALGTVVPSALARREARAGPGWNPWRQAIAERIRERVVDRDAAALIAGLAVGATTDMTREQWRVFGATGTVHLVAISGLHVTMFAWLATGLARLGWRLGRLGRLLDREPFAAGVGLLAATGYALLAGFSVPTQRTLVMLAVWWAARLAGRPQGGLEVLGLALLAVLAVEPLAPLSAGFWLSFAAIAVLIAGESAPGASGGALARAWHWLRELLATQWRVTVALAPATLMLFGSVPLAGLVANLVAIPLFSALLVPLILASLAAWPLAPDLAGWGWHLAETLYLAAWPLLEAMADMPGAVWSVAPEIAWLPIGLLALPWVLLRGPWALRGTALLALLPLLGTPRLSLAPGEFVAWLLDTGDGVALLVVTQAHALLYDTGDVYGSDGSRALGVVLPALQSLGRRDLDVLVQSRANAFRVAGVAALLSRTPVGEVRSGGLWTAPPRRVAGCTSASGWYWDDVEVRIFPGAAAAPPGADPPSCVLRVAANGGRGPALLVPAQVDRTEAILLSSRAAQQRLRADVVVAPRRGSPVAAAPAFVGAIGAEHVLVANREMPDARRALLARTWRVPHDRVVGTARDGALRVSPTAGGRGVEVRRLVDLQPRWIWRLPRE